MYLSPEHPLVSGDTENSRLIQALRGQRPDVTPVWFMRQAGRSLPEYRELRKSSDMLEACLTPSLASEITMQPVRRHGVDAAILFSDIVVPLKLLDLPVEIVPGRGPVFAEAVNSASAIARVTAIDPEELYNRSDELRQAVQATVAMLGDTADVRGEPIPLIGFAGAPFTLAAYMVEGGPSKDHFAARQLQRQDPVAWTELMSWTADVTGAFLSIQVRAGASAAQLFDSWAGSLSPRSYRDHSQWASRRALATVSAIRIPGEVAQDTVPIIHFGVGTGELLVDMVDVGVDALGVDYRMDLSEALERVGRPIPLQGNLDPAALFSSPKSLEAEVHSVLKDGLAAPSHVFNLGHGVPQGTDPDALTKVVDLVHRWRPPT
jgi:uroporphyrinogen decarboxylase